MAITFIIHAVTCSFFSCVLWRWWLTEKVTFEEILRGGQIWPISYLALLLKYVTNIIGEPSYKYGQQEQVIVRNHSRSTALERSVLKYWVWVGGGGWGGEGCLNIVSTSASQVSQMSALERKRIRKVFLAHPTGFPRDWPRVKTFRRHRRRKEPNRTLSGANWKFLHSG